jgi:hypothetical protein
MESKVLELPLDLAFPPPFIANSELLVAGLIVLLVLALVLVLDPGLCFPSPLL